MGLRSTSTRYLYLCTEPPSNNVIISQVVEYLTDLRASGIEFRLVFPLDWGHYRKRQNDAALYAAIRQKVADVICLPAPLKSTSLGMAWITTLLRPILLRIPGPQPIIIHARNIWCACVAAKLQAADKRVRFICDVRGDSIAERDFMSQQAGVSQQVMQAQREMLLGREAFALAHAGRVSCVSASLKQRLVDRHKIDPDKVVVIPCCASRQRFYFDPAIRQSVREKLGVQDKKVFIYAGALNAYHCGPRMLDIMREMMAINDDAFFILLSPAAQAISQTVASALPAGRYIVKQAAPAEVPEHLMAADMGILLEENHPRNVVGPPVKFAEYTMTGLPILMSEYIGDGSRWIRDNDFGMVVTDDLPPDQCAQRANAYLEGSCQDRRGEMAQLAASSFSKETYLPALLALYRQLGA